MPREAGAVQAAFVVSDGENRPSRSPPAAQAPWRSGEPKPGSTATSSSTCRRSYPGHSGPVYLTIRAMPIGAAR